MDSQTPSPATPYPARAAWITLAVLLAGAAFLGFQMARPFVGPALTGMVIAVIFYPVHEGIARRVPRPALAAALSTVLLVLVFLGPFSTVIVTVSRDVRDLYQSLGPNAVNEGAQRLWGKLEGPVGTIATRLGLDLDALRDAAVARLGEAGGVLLRQSVTVIGAATGSVVFVVLSAIAFFFSLKDGPALYRRTLVWSPLGERHTRELLDATGQMIVASFYGVLAVALAQGFLTGVAAWITGLPSALLWGVVATAASVIPFVGSALVWIPAAIVLFVEGSIGKGIFMLVWGVGVIGMVDNFVRPLVIRSRMPLNLVLVSIAMLGGAQAFGLAGILIGPVTLTVIVTLVRIMGERAKG